MRRFLLVLAALAVSNASYAAMTCEAFKSELAGAIVKAGHKVAFPAGYTQTYKREDGTLTRYKWFGIVGLSGNLRCGKADVFEGFSIETSDAPPKLVIDRAKHLAAAALQAGSGISPKESSSLVEKTIKEALADHAAARKRGEPGEEGTAYNDTQNGGQINVSASPKNIMMDIFPSKH